MPSISPILPPPSVPLASDGLPAPDRPRELVTPLAPASPKLAPSPLATPNTGGALRPTRVPIATTTGDVVPTGNEVMSLPTIRASDGAIMDFNVLSMRERGLLDVSGGKDTPALRPYVKVDGHEVTPRNVAWDVAGYWVPTARYDAHDLSVSYTYAAPADERGTLVRVQVTNQGAKPATVDLGLQLQWSAFNRGTYTPVEQSGKRLMAEQEPDAHEAAFTYGEPGSESFAFTLNHAGATPMPTTPAADGSPRYSAERKVTLEPGASAEANFVLGIGVDQLSSEAAAGAIASRIDRAGSEVLVRDTAAWAQARTRTTGRADLDTLMNRNYLFTRLYAWGRTYDSDQVVGVTSRSPRYYVSAAYWDRDAMLWSFPALLDTDTKAAREALQYALTTQLHNTGIHSRFIDGVVLESGFQLDEACAPVTALAAYVAKTGDTRFLEQHRDALESMQERIYGRRDDATGLYSSLKDSQDEYQREPFMTYDNVLVWKTLGDMATLWDKLGDHAASAEARKRAAALKPAIMATMVGDGAPGATGPIFAVRTDGTKPVFADVPPGSLLKLPALGFIKEDDPLFARTYDWLHSRNNPYGYADAPFGLPGSYRLPFTTSWTMADEMRLKRGEKKAVGIALGSPWDAGIVTEGMNPTTGVPDEAGRAFATAAGYVAHTICDQYCTDTKR